jgi:dethiobiotin synthetase
LPRYARAPLLGAMPAHVGNLSRPAFLSAARGGLGPQFGGTWHPELS